MEPLDNHKKKTIKELYDDLAALIQEDGDVSEQIDEMICILRAVRTDTSAVERAIDRIERYAALWNLDPATLTLEKVLESEARITQEIKDSFAAIFKAILPEMEKESNVRSSDN